MKYEKNKKFNRIIFGSLLAIMALMVACTTTPSADVAPQVPQIPAVQIPDAASSSVIPAINLRSYSAEAIEGDSSAIMWSLKSESPLMATHTAIHYDIVSHPGSFGTEIGPADSGYPSLTSEYASGSFGIPSDFSTGIIIPKGDMVYFRAHAMIDGMNYWTDEYTIKIMPRQAESQAIPAAPAVPAAVMTPFDGAPYDEYFFSADNKGIYPAELNLTQGDNVKFTFRVLQDNSNPDGLEFTTLLRDVWGTTKTVPVGGTSSVYFTAQSSFKFGVYIPGGVLEQVATITVLDEKGNILGSSAIGDSGMSGGYSY